MCIIQFQFNRSITKLTFLSANLSGKICVTILPAPLELLRGGDASELVDIDFSDFVLIYRLWKKERNKIKKRKKHRMGKQKQLQKMSVKMSI